MWRVIISFKISEMIHLDFETHIVGCQYTCVTPLLVYAAFQSQKPVIQWLAIVALYNIGFSELFCSLVWL